VRDLSNLDIKNKTALVTGASRGIGKSISVALAESGARVILSARDTRRLETVRKEINDKGGNAVAIPADLSEEADIVSLFDEIKKRYERLDIAVHNAGVGYFEDLADFPMDKFDEIFRVNMRGTFLCCKHAMKLMIPARAGYIINVSSMQGIKGYPKQSAYAATKHGIMGMTKSLSAEAQKHNIRVSVILPGAVDTELITDARPELDRSLLIHPEDISKAVLFLLSLSGRAMVDMLVIRRSTASPF
jgi:NAD(P)-dependent dehydrogenase (short-subunit alcohol dehydrogenase family)